jgi:hypothetical protein
MSQDAKPIKDSPFARWSRLKREARENRKEKDSVATAGTVAAATTMTAPAGPATSSGPMSATLSGSAPATATGASPSTEPGGSRDAASATGGDELPPVESLTFDSDFAPYFQPQVDAALQRQALKRLLRDPHFNVMDGLDIYIDDYTKSDPIPPEIVREMVQGRYIFDPPPTRINAQGHVEDVPPEELVAFKEAKAAAEAEAAASGGSAPATADAANMAAGAAAVQIPASPPAGEIPLAANPPAGAAAKDDSAR